MEVKTSLRLSAALLVPALLSLAACSADSGLDGAEIADQVQQAQEKETPDLEITDATCPDVEEPTKGSSVSCTLELAGVEAPYDVTFTKVGDDGAEFDIESTKAIILVSKVIGPLEQDAIDQGLEDVTADCGDAAVLVQDPDTTFTCTLTMGDRTQDVTLRITDLEGNVVVEG